MVDAGLAGQSGQQARGVQPRARAEHPAPGQTQAQCQLTGDNVAGVGDVDENAVKAGGLHVFHIAVDSGDSEVHLSQAVVVPAKQINFSHAVDDHVAVSQIGEIPHGYMDEVVAVCRKVEPDCIIHR